MRKENEMAKTTVSKAVYLAARNLAIEVLRDNRIGVLCPHCRGDAAWCIIEDGVIVGIRCRCPAGGKDGIIFGREASES